MRPTPARRVRPQRRGSVSFDDPLPFGPGRARCHVSPRSAVPPGTLRDRRPTRAPSRTAGRDPWRWFGEGWSRDRCRSGTCSIDPAAVRDGTASEWCRSHYPRRGWERPGECRRCASAPRRSGCRPGRGSSRCRSRRGSCRGSRRPSARRSNRRDPAPVRATCRRTSRAPVRSSRRTSPLRPASAAPVRSRRSWGVLSGRSGCSKA